MHEFACTYEYIPRRILQSQNFFEQNYQLYSLIYTVGFIWMVGYFLMCDVTFIKDLTIYNNSFMMTNRFDVVLEKLFSELIIQINLNNQYAWRCWREQFFFLSFPFFLFSMYFTVIALDKSCHCNGYDIWWIIQIWFAIQKNKNKNRKF